MEDRKEVKVALVTGANRGIGYAVVHELLTKGYTVLLTSRNEIQGMRAFRALKDVGRLHYHALDVTDAASIEKLKAFVIEKWGRMDVLINNAGINYDTWHHALNANLDEVRNTFEVNLYGPWKLAQTFVPLIQQHHFGRIVNVSSGAGALNGMTGGTPGYSLSKAALNALTIKLARHVREQNILVNAVCPGWVRTDMGGSEAPRSPERAAKSIVWVAELPNAGPTGKFFRD